MLAVTSPTGLRVALFSGNYNYVRDGANQALNRLVEYLLRQGAAVRVYSPKVEHPAFEPAGDLVGLPNLPIPGRGEYRVALMLGDSSIKRVPRLPHNSERPHKPMRATEGRASRSSPFLLHHHFPRNGAIIFG